MITTDLTLINGATSEAPAYIVGITFEVDSKIAVNPATTFPFTIAIDSNVVVGIDFDNTLHTGDYSEQITINTGSGENDITMTVTITDVSELPTAVTDFNAINGLGQVTFMWDNTTGTAPITYNIFEDGIEVGTDVDQSFVQVVAVGTRVYGVEAVNAYGEVMSNFNVGISGATPTAIADFEATDDEHGTITMTYTPSTGYPLPTHDLYEDDILIVEDIDTGYVHTIAESTHVYHVTATSVINTITSNDDSGTSLPPALRPPSAIVDFEATDDEVGQVTCTWTNATGDPTPTYNLFEDTIEVATGVTTPHIHTVVAGTYTYRVDAVNSEGTVPSNDYSGTSTEAYSALVTALPNPLVFDLADVAYAPDAITDLSASMGNTIADLSWSAPSDGGDAITGYVVEYKLTTEPTVWTDAGHVGIATTQSITGLTNDVGYDFRAYAVNAVGTSLVSNIATGTPTSAPATIIQNGDFSDGSNHWVLLETTVVTDGKAVFDGLANTWVGLLEQSITIDVAKSYTVTFDASDIIDSGYIRVNIDDISVTYQCVDGANSVVLAGMTTGETFSFRSESSSFNGKIDNVVIEETV